MSYENQKSGHVISNETHTKLKEPLKSKYVPSDKKVPAKAKVDRPEEVAKGK